MGGNSPPQQSPEPTYLGNPLLPGRLQLGSSCSQGLFHKHISCIKSSQNIKRSCKCDK